jgi:hypothetical protein
LRAGGAAGAHATRAAGASDRAAQAGTATCAGNAPAGGRSALTAQRMQFRQSWPGPRSAGSLPGKATPASPAVPAVVHTETGSTRPPCAASGQPAGATRVASATIAATQRRSVAILIVNGGVGDPFTEAYGMEAPLP